MTEKFLSRQIVVFYTTISMRNFSTCFTTVDYTMNLGLITTQLVTEITQIFIINFP